MVEVSSFGVSDIVIVKHIEGEPSIEASEGSLPPFSLTARSVTESRVGSTIIGKSKGSFMDMDLSLNSIHDGVIGDDGGVGGA